MKERAEMQLVETVADQVFGMRDKFNSRLDLTNAICKDIQTVERLYCVNGIELPALDNHTFNAVMERLVALGNNH